MRLSLDIMLTAGAFVVLVAGAALLEPLGEGRGVRPGSENTARVRDGVPMPIADAWLTGKVARVTGLVS